MSMTLTHQTHGKAWQKVPRHYWFFATQNQGISTNTIQDQVVSTNTIQDQIISTNTIQDQIISTKYSWA